MQPNRFFYIITRDKQIFELQYTPERLAGAIASMRDKGLLMIQGQGIVLNGVDISKVLDGAQYENFLATTKPTLYIKGGVWYNKVHDAMRYEPWKKKEMESIKKIESSPTEDVSPEEKEKVSKGIKEYLASIRPNKSV